MSNTSYVRSSYASSALTFLLFVVFFSSALSVCKLETLRSRQMRKENEIDRGSTSVPLNSSHLIYNSYVQIMTFL